MTQEQTIMLRLLRLGIGKADAVQGDAAMLEDGAVDWKTMMQASINHGIMTLCCDGYGKVKELFHISETGIESPALEDNRMEWIGYTFVLESSYINYRAIIAQLAKFYAKRGIDMMLLKGYGLSLHYPIPSHRPTGDIDVFLFGKWREGDEAIRKKGIKIKIDSEHHTTFKIGGVTVENHYDFVNTRIRRSSRLLEKEFKALAMNGERQQIDINGVTVFVPTPNLNALFLLRHTAGHFASEGIKLRNVLDWAFFVEKQGTLVDWNRLWQLAKEYNMHRFLECLNAICVEDLGFANELFPHKDCDKSLKTRVLEEILAGPDIKKDASAWLRTKRWWQHRWKHEICYSDSMFSSFITSITANIIPTRPD